jgi:hypothetical protein
VLRRSLHLLGGDVGKERQRHLGPLPVQQLSDGEVLQFWKNLLVRRMSKTLSVVYHLFDAFCSWLKSDKDAHLRLLSLHGAEQIASHPRVKRLPALDRHKNFTELIFSAEREAGYVAQAIWAPC